MSACAIWTPRFGRDQHAGWVLIEVWDSSPHPPAPKTADPDEETGRGLMLVEALCEQWGWDEPSSASRGKVVWALVGR